MDHRNIDRLRQLLTLHFVVIAFLTAILVSFGSESLFLPIFILVFSIVGLIVVDVWHRFELGPIGVFLGMSLGTLFSIGSYLYSTIYTESSSGQLHAVASLLVFPEAVLFLQRKNLRVYEQMAMFLLLEMMVAALVNDNLLFGILLVPIVLLWVSSLFLFTRYVSFVQLAPSIDVPLPKMFEVLFAHLKKSILGTEKPVATITSQANGNPLFDSKRSTFHSVPIGIGAIVFSAMFFYFLPRTTPGGLRSLLNGQQQVGLPERISLGQMGRILRDPTGVMRLKLTKPEGGNYEVYEGPYIRARVLDSSARIPSRDGGTRTVWTLSANISETIPIEAFSKLTSSAVANRDQVLVEFDLFPAAHIHSFTLPPVYSGKESSLKDPGLHVDTQMLVRKSEIEDDVNRIAKPYKLGTTAFVNGRQLRITPAAPFGQDNQLPSVLEPEKLLKVDPAAYVGTDELRQRIIEKASTASNIYGTAKAIERYFSMSGDFAYSLELDPPDPSLDPIEDFVLNQRKGHCQYFAAATLVMMRQSGIPTRLVIGYKPRHFNSRGQYFWVQQRDAHAWVEGLFSAADLANSELNGFITPNTYYWVRFDGTPALESEDEIIEQPNAFQDYAQRLWKGYVLDAREIAGENNLYAPLDQGSKDFYMQLADQWRDAKSNLMSGRFGEQGISIGFAWPLAILIFVIGVLAILAWQFVRYLPRFAPKFAKRLGIGQRASDYRQPFFARCALLLNRMGFKRSHHETPQELTASAAEYMKNRGHTDSTEWLATITQTYYRLRYKPSESLTSQDEADVHLALKNLERSIKNLR